MENEMKTKNKFWKGVLVGSLVTTFAVLVLVGVALGISLVGRMVIDSQAQTYSRDEEGPGTGETNSENRIDLGEVNQKIELLEQMIERNFLFEENIDADKMEAGIYKGMLSGLDDPYTVYYTPEEYEALTEETEGVYYGIGALVSQNMETKIITALRIFKGSPAEEAGMKRGDIFYRVGDIDPSTMDFDVLVQEEIRGAEGTYVDITVLRGGEEITLHIQRREVEVTTVEYQMLNDEVGYILITQFEMVTADQFREAVEALTKEGMKKMIIDLRDNPGGVLEPTVEMAAYMLPEDKLDGTLVSTADKNGRGDRYYSEGGQLCYESDTFQQDPHYPKEDGHQVDMPVVVLMNENSASASEVFAGALRDYGRAKLVGTTSFGKGIVQSLVTLDDGSAVKLTTSHYYTPGGVDLHKKGLEPDVEIEYEIPEDLDENAFEVPLEKDNQVQKAIEVLSGE